MANIEIDGKKLHADNGQMIIEVADEAGIHIPRFCYHKKLSVAANCRMCLVEVENGRKTVPACATPITDGMKVFTKSKEAIRSQQAVMEFLLINHPLDCPICDQGGECELQDVSLGYGPDTSDYEESKRSVVNDDLGALVDTEMTRCIHCTRCVRFGEEIAGLRELGAMGRGEHMQIGTFVKHSLTSEVSANIIDLCPVGALTSKPYRFTARAWELTQFPSIALHDCLGSHIYLHTRRNQLMRVVPREADDLNETWLSDRDRFSYLGVNSARRAMLPLIKRNGQWESTDWETALQYTSDKLNRILHEHGPNEIAALASPSASLEALYLLQKWMRSIGVANLDYRLQQTDFSDAERLPVLSTNTLAYADLEKQQTIFLVGCHVNREVPLAALRMRKAQLNDGCIYALNSVDYTFAFELANKKIVSPQLFPTELLKVVKALVVDEHAVPESVSRWVADVEVDEVAAQIAEALRVPNAVIVTGAIAENHPAAALIRSLVALIATLSGAHCLHFTTGANAQGARLAGMLPHAGPMGASLESTGLDVQAALAAQLKSYILMEVDPSFDIASPYAACQAMLAAEFVVALTAFQSDSIKEYADVILPIATFSESAGTYINVDGTWQTVQGAIAPAGEARPVWKVLRVLAQFMQQPGFEMTSSDEVRDALLPAFQCMSTTSYQPAYPDLLPIVTERLVRVGEWPLYRLDALVRHADALQACVAADSAAVRIHPATAAHLQLGEDTVTVAQGEIEVTLPLQRDERIAPEVIWVPNALLETVDLGHAFAPIMAKR